MTPNDLRNDGRRALELFGPPIYVRHEGVHNTFVVDDLRARLPAGRTTAMPGRRSATSTATLSGPNRATGPASSCAA